MMQARQRQTPERILLHTAQAIFNAEPNPTFCGSPHKSCCNIKHIRIASNAASVGINYRLPSYHSTPDSQLLTDDARNTI